MSIIESVRTDEPVQPERVIVLRLPVDVAEKMAEAIDSHIDWDAVGLFQEFMALYQALAQGDTTG